MLKELRIRNFALIEQLNIEFSDGLNVLTGETGAGKSILLDSIGILCGKRASSEFIRRGEDRATVEGYFNIENDLRLLLNNLDLIEIEENEIFMSREISVSGANKCKINYKTAPLNVYQKIGSYLFDIHGQNQEQSIMSNDKQLELVDKFLKTTKKDNHSLEDVKIIYLEYKSLLNKRKELAFNEKEDMISYYEFAIKEIDDANLSEEEDLKLREDRTRILNGEKLMKKASSIYSQLNENGIVDRLNSVSFTLKEISSLDPSLDSLTAKFSDLYYEIDSLSNEFKNYYNNLDYDEDRINSIENRIAEVNKLKRKYGKSVLEIIEKRNEMEDKIKKFSNINQLKIDLENEISEKLALYNEKSGILTKLRNEAALQLISGIKNKLKELNIYENGFDINFALREDPGENGLDIVEFYFSPNIGEGIQPLKKIASGGEISRVMLALKGVLAEYDIIPSLIFDEIDSGVGGEALLKVAEALEKIGRKRQVICVSHSAIMGAFADRIIAVSKKEVDSRTFIEAISLDSEIDKIEELSRMLGGKDNFNASKVQSKEMILFALSKKKV
ncbi:MAG: DNA replication and repair protein RecN [Fusobacteria bacterium]|nr:MAG: DNA replication and repair protein RecN [Fusobacteriota bacterium]KAF0229889.1 MAG: DNA replication and repair protein [Fusobacteriota bacterium]